MHPSSPRVQQGRAPLRLATDFTGFLFGRPRSIKVNALDFARKQGPALPLLLAVVTGLLVRTAVAAPPAGLELAHLRAVSYRLHFNDGPPLSPEARMAAITHDLPRMPGDAGQDPVSLTVLDSPLAYGDLDGDGQPEAVVVLASEGSVNATFFDLAVVTSRQGRAVNIASRYLGQNLSPETIVLRPGSIEIRLLTVGAGDAQCCPSHRVLRRFAFAKGKLTATH
jgi:hypothetical protein